MTAPKKAQHDPAIARRNKIFAEAIDEIKKDKQLAANRTYHSGAMYEFERARVRN